MATRRQGRVLTVVTLSIPETPQRPAMLVTMIWPCMIGKAALTHLSHTCQIHTRRPAPHPHAVPAGSDALRHGPLWANHQQRPRAQPGGRPHVGPGADAGGSAGVCMTCALPSRQCHLRVTLSLPCTVRCCFSSLLHKHLQSAAVFEGSTNFLACVLAIAPRLSSRSHRQSIWRRLRQRPPR